MATMTITKVLVPTEEDVRGLKVGDLAPNCFHQVAEVTDINYVGQDVNGKWFVHYYVKFGDNARISHSMKEGVVEMSVAMISQYMRSDIVEKMIADGELEAVDLAGYIESMEKN